MYAIIPVLWQNVKVFTVDSRNPSHHYKDFSSAFFAPSTRRRRESCSFRPPLLCFLCAFSAIDLCVSAVRVVFLFGSGFAGSGSGCSAARQFRSEELLRTSAPPPVGPKRSVAPTSSSA